MLSIIIPTKNEEKGISKVIIDIEKQDLHNFEILVVDNSTDKTRYKVTKLMKKYSNLRLIEGLENGKGAAMRLGIKEAKGNIIFFMDGDGTHPPQYIPRMIEKLNNCNMVVATHLLEKRKDRNLYSVIFYDIYPIIARRMLKLKDFKTTEYVTGMRTLRKKDFKKLNLQSKDFSIEAEMELKAIKNKFKIIEISIPLKKRIGHSKFFIQPKQWFKIRKIIDKNRKLLKINPEIYRVVDYSR